MKSDQEVSEHKVEPHQTQQDEKRMYGTVYGLFYLGFQLFLISLPIYFVYEAFGFIHWLRIPIHNFYIDFFILLLLTKFHHLKEWIFKFLDFQKSFNLMFSIFLKSISVYFKQQYQTIKKQAILLYHSGYGKKGNPVPDTLTITCGSSESLLLIVMLPV